MKKEDYEHLHDVCLGASIQLLQSVKVKTPGETITNTMTTVGHELIEAAEQMKQRKGDDQP